LVKGGFAKQNAQVLRIAFGRRFALVSAVAKPKMNAQRIRLRAFVTSKQATLGRAKSSIEKHYLVFTYNHLKTV